MILSRADYYKHSFYGGMLGDVLGSVYEFEPRELIPANLTLEEVLSNKENHFGHKIGSYTDDTIFMLCAMSSFIEVGGFDADNQMYWINKYVREGKFSQVGYCFDIGYSTIASLNDWLDGKNVSKDNRLGNGVLMKLAPYAYMSTIDPGVTPTSVTRLTHGDGCISTTSEMMNALVSLYSVEIPEMKYSPTVDRNDERNGNHAVALEVAKYCYSESSSVLDGILTAITFGYDMDTTACIAGQLLGPRYGVHWPNAIDIPGEIVDLVEEFTEMF